MHNLIIYTAEPGAASEDRLKLLASWAATQSREAGPTPISPARTALIRRACVVLVMFGLSDRVVVTGRVGAGSGARDRGDPDGLVDDGDELVAVEVSDCRRCAASR